VAFPTFKGTISGKIISPTGTHGCYGSVGGGKFELTVHHAHDVDTFSGPIDDGPLNPISINGSGSYAGGQDSSLLRL